MRIGDPATLATRPFYRPSAGAVKPRRQLGWLSRSGSQVQFHPERGLRFQAEARHGANLLTGQDLDSKALEQRSHGHRDQQSSDLATDTMPGARSEREEREPV